MNEQKTELHYAKNIAKQRKTQRNIFIVLFSFMTVLFIISATSLVLGSIAHNKTNELNYYLDYDYEAHWGATIWEHKSSGKHLIELYFSNIKWNKDDIKWNGNYPKGYFNN